MRASPFLLTTQRPIRWAGTLLAAWLLTAAPPAPAQGPPAAVSVLPVLRHTFSESMEVIGEAQAFRRGRASAEVDGLVVALNVEEGQAVQPPQVLLRIKDSLVKIRERGAAAQLELARQQLKEYENGARPEEIRESKARLDEALAQQKQADDDLTRTKGLVAGGAATDQDLIAATARSQVTHALVALQKASHDRILRGPRKEQIARARAQMDIRQAELDEIKDELARAMIRAPFKGVVTRKLVDLGHFVKRGDAVLEMIQIDPIRITVPVPERVVMRIRAGLELQIHFDARPKLGVKGKVEAIVPEADQEARTFPVKVVLPNPDGSILPGMVARVDVPLSKPRLGLAVSRDAIVRGPRGATVWVVREGQATPVAVQTGASSGVLVEVKGALKAGDLVVVRGNERLRPGQAVRIKTHVRPGGSRRKLP